MISIFAWPAHYYKRGTISNRTPHLFRGSSLIRGNQISEHIGAKLNPEDGYGSDVCIYVKPYELKGIKKGSYVDIVDCTAYIRRLKNYPDLNIIVLSDEGKRHLERRGLKNKIVVIPQHHCNIENLKRERREITKVGFIGSPDSFSLPWDEFAGKMAKLGLEFVTNTSFSSREEVVGFYKEIDIQVSWSIDLTVQKRLRDSLRLKNAASFGIPTLAYPEINYREFEGNYIKAETPEIMVEEIRKLTDPKYYDSWSEKVIKAAEPFHISRIAEKYKCLK